MTVFCSGLGERLFLAFRAGSECVDEQAIAFKGCRYGRGRLLERMTRRDFEACPRYDRRVGETVIDWRKYLLSRRDIANGQLCAKGTRVPVAVILDSLAEGATVDEVVSSYPSLKTAHVRAA